VSERIVNGTSAQISYTVPFTPLYIGKYRTEDKSKQTLLKLSTAQNKANNTKHSKTKLAWFSRLLRHLRWAYSTMLTSLDRAF